MAKRKGHRQPTKKFKSFSDLHGSRSDVFKPVSGSQLGHDQQLDVNPAAKSSPLLNPGSPNSLGIGQAMGNEPSGEEYY